MIRIIRLAALVLLATPAPAAPDVTRLAFGSCCREDRPAPVFQSIRRFQPHVWIWMGDNIYADTVDMERLQAKYDRLSAVAGYRALREACTVIGTWDDHDYGRNDAGKEYPERKASQQRFLDFLGVADDDPRRTREGVYASHTFGGGERRVKVILLDTRYHRDPPGPDADTLGEAQWRWLESELAGSDAAVHLLVSSIQVVASEHRFEKWGNFPKAHERLYALLSRPDVPPVVILSGDRHLAEVSVERKRVPYPLHDLTSSSLNQPMGGNKDEPNTRRLGQNFRGPNFGTITIDWDTGTLHAAIRDVDGTVVRTAGIPIAR